MVCCASLMTVIGLLSTFPLPVAHGQMPVAGQTGTAPLPQGVSRVPVVFSGGHETDPRDNGRPVVLIAAALGVPSDVFRTAFSRVRPAGAGREPEPGQVQANKSALMNALAKYGVTNEQLDAVSDFYRYVRSRNELWPTKPAVANALVKNGDVIGYEVISGGSGYSSAPTVFIPNMHNATPTVELSFGKNRESNGSIRAIIVPVEKRVDITS